MKMRRKKKSQILDRIFIIRKIYLSLFVFLEKALGKI